MSEKLSERPIREDKVKRLKAKILAEIAQEQEMVKQFMSEDNDALFDKNIEMYYWLTKLKEYIEVEHAFWGYEAMSEADDCIIYQVPERDLDIWLQDHYNFTLNFMLAVADRPWALFDMLNDHYFGYHFTNLIEIMAYEDKEKHK